MVVVLVNYRRELERFQWQNAKWSSKKLIASSPFRYDRKPSFFVDLRTGGWADSGATDPEWASGNFVKLLSFLRGETEEETKEYLRSVYGPSPSNDLTLDMSMLCLPERRAPLDLRLLDEYRYRHPYLKRRGISEKVQRLMRIGYDRRRNAITIPWFLPDGRLGNVKYRRTDSKVFWYHRGGIPISSLVYGMNIVYRYHIREVILCEAEIDAMSAMTMGYPAVAIGGSFFSEKQRDIIVRSHIEKVIVATDNDEVGQRLKTEVRRLLEGFIEVQEIVWPNGVKDLNDILTNCELINIASLIK